MMRGLLDQFAIEESPKKLPLVGLGLQRALEVALKAFVAHQESDGSYYIFALDKKLTSLLLRFKPIYEILGYSAEKKKVGYEVLDLPYEEWLEHWNSSREAADYIRYMTYGLLADRRPEPIPVGFLTLAYMLIRGQLTYPRKARSPNRKTHRDYLMAAVAHWVADNWDTTYAVDGINLGEPGDLAICGATISAACMHALGEKIQPRTALNICFINRKIAKEALENGDIIIVENALSQATAPANLQPVRKITDADIASAMAYLGQDYPT